MDGGETLARESVLVKELYMEKHDCEALPLAIASVPMQRFEDLYPPEVALEKGTMFDALYLPFEAEEEC